MTAIYVANVGTGRTVTEIHMGWHSGRYEIRAPRGFTIVEMRYGDFVGALVATEPIRWHPAYWLWRWRHRHAPEAIAPEGGGWDLLPGYPPDRSS